MVIYTREEKGKPKFVRIIPKKGKADERKVINMENFYFAVEFPGETGYNKLRKIKTLWICD